MTSPSHLSHHLSCPAPAHRSIVLRRPPDPRGPLTMWNMDMDYTENTIALRNAKRRAALRAERKDDLETPLASTFQRFVVVKHVATVTESSTSQVIIYEITKDGGGSKAHRLSLRDCWAQTPILPPGTVINICDVGPDENDEFVVERVSGYFIVDPDRLISVTSIVGMNWCERKVALSEYFRFPIETKDILRGNLAHEIICKTMTKENFDPRFIQGEMATMLKDPEVLEKAYGLGLSQKELNSLGLELVDYVGHISTRMGSEPPKAGRSRGHTVNISKVLDIEECCWSPNYGIKGKIDCTVAAVNSSEKETEIPVEFKTGRPLTNKRQPTVRADQLGQVHLYSLMKGCIESGTPSGLLYLIREKHMAECAANMNELQSLIMTRNRIVLNVKALSMKPAFSGLPRPYNVDFDRQCKTCEYRNVCAMGAAFMGPSPSPDGSFLPTESKLMGSLAHIDLSVVDWAHKWLNIMRVEAEEDMSNRTTKRLWLSSIVDREMEGVCIGELTLHSQRQDPATFKTIVTFQIQEERKHLVVNFTEKEFVVIGKKNSPCVGYAYIEEINPKSVTLSIEREIIRFLDARYTIDKVSSYNAGSTQFVYLSKLLDDNKFAESVRQRLILKKPPEFQDIPLHELTKDIQRVLEPLNKTQRLAVMKCLTTNSAMLINGSPGCGKTKTIVSLVRILMLKKKSVLISSYTSNALDNILLALKEHNNDFLRIGSGGKLAENQLRENSTDHLRTLFSNADDLTRFYNDKTVVGTTLLSLKHPFFTNRRFDYCIVDEASQALPSAVLGALLLVDKWVVFGDPNQLPATLKSRRLYGLDLEDSVFSMIGHDQNPDFYSPLTVQYRMNQVIMRVANHLLYKGEMRCASEDQAKDYLKVSRDVVEHYLLYHCDLLRTRNWLCTVVSKKPARSVMFYDTHKLDAFESPVASSLKNSKERDIIIEILRLLIGCKISPSDIGVITPYRGQVQLLRDNLSKMKVDIEVNTVDQYQGREKDVIIVSFTKSIRGHETVANPSQSILSDVRRLNVAITRARRKVILVGNSSTLTHFPACNRLLSLLHEKDQKYAFIPTDFVPDFFCKEP